MPSEDQTAKKNATSRGPGAKATTTRMRNRLVTAFVAFHVFAIALFAAPFDAAPLRIAREFLSPYMLCVGLNQSWDTFAPNPRPSEQFLKAVVVTLRGNTAIYSFPRMEDLSYSQRYSKERYRKFSESILCDDCAGLWPDVERFVARRYADPLDPPDKVILIKFVSPIDPQRNLLGDDQHATPTTLSEFSVQSEDLDHFEVKH